MRALLCVILVGLGVYLGAASQSRADVPAPSFGCTPNAPAIEGAICGDPKLAAEDRLMARLYALAQVSAFGSGPSNQPAVQRAWIKSRDQTCAETHDAAACLSSMYAERNERLALAVLFSHPDVALPELQRLDPEAAPMFEAVHLYARTPRLSGGDRRRVATLLEPYKDTPGGWGEPAAAVKGDAAFAEFIGVRSAGLPDINSGRAFPCAAAVRKPKLVEATDPRFGSNMDNFILASDCDETLPPLPKLETLVQHRRSGMTDCGGGSIRFAYFSAFRNAAVAARLATGTQIRKTQIKPIVARRKVTTADINAALGELSAYYVRYGRANASDAPRLARQMIYNLLDQAWQC